MNRLTANLIWGGQHGKRKYHLSKLSFISTPKSHGGWGLLDMRSFGKALLYKSFWRGICDHGIWGSIIQDKYLGRKDLSYWIRKGSIGPAHGSPIWLSMRKVEALIRKNLIWRFQTGDKIMIRRDSFLCGKEEIDIPGSLLEFSHRKGILFWDGMINKWNGPFPIWYEPSCLNM